MKKRGHYVEQSRHCFHMANVKYFCDDRARLRVHIFIAFDQKTIQLQQQKIKQKN